MAQPPHLVRRRCEARTQAGQPCPIGASYFDPVDSSQWCHVHADRFRMQVIPGRKVNPTQVLPFGKHRGQTYRAIATFDAQYLRWLLGQNWISPSVRRAATDALMTTHAAPQATDLQAR